MSLFRRKPPAIPLTLDEILQFVRNGDPQGALEAAAAKLETVAKSAGTASPRYAAQLFEHANVFIVLGMLPRAIQALREAGDLRGPAPEDEKNRLTYLMNLSETLAAHGELEEAASVAARALQDRERFYGKEHPGYAYGLENVADLAIARGHYADALTPAREALAIYDRFGHPRIPSAWALLFLAAAGAKLTWQQLSIDDSTAKEVLGKFTARATPVAAAVQRQAVELVAPFARDAEVVERAWLAVQERAQTEGDHRTRIAALERIVALADERNDLPLAIDAGLGLGMCHEAVGDLPLATECYERVVVRARRHGAAETLVKALRNAGLFFVERDSQRGLVLLREAVSVPHAPPGELALTRLALGIQLQHRGELGEAQALLAAGLAAMEPTHPDAICARSHLRAIEQQGSCGCGQPADEVHAQVERIVRDRLPPGLLEALEFGEGGVSIRVTRSLTESEARLVADTVELAMTELRKRLAARG